MTLLPDEPFAAADSDEALNAAFRLFKLFHLTPMVQYDLVALRGLLPARVDRLANRLYEALTPMAEHLSLDILNNAFEKALADEAITAWVCANDEIALYALKYLQRRGVDVPGRVSVTGFDDIPESYSEGLTSYSFEIDSVAGMVLDHILRPPQTRTNGGPFIVETEGEVVERASSSTVETAHR